MVALAIVLHTLGVSTKGPQRTHDDKNISELNPWPATSLGTAGTQYLGRIESPLTKLDLAFWDVRFGSARFYPGVSLRKETC